MVFAFILHNSLKGQCHELSGVSVETELKVKAEFLKVDLTN